MGGPSWSQSEARLLPDHRVWADGSDGGTGGLRSHRTGVLRTDERDRGATRTRTREGRRSHYGYHGRHSRGVWRRVSPLREGAERRGAARGHLAFRGRDHAHLLAERDHARVGTISRLPRFGSSAGRSVPGVSDGRRMDQCRCVEPVHVARIDACARDARARRGFALRGQRRSHGGPR